MRTGFVQFYHSDSFDALMLVNLGKVQICNDCENIHLGYFYQNANEK